MGGGGAGRQKRTEFNRVVSRLAFFKRRCLKYSIVSTEGAAKLGDESIPLILLFFMFCI